MNGLVWPLAFHGDDAHAKVGADAGDYAGANAWYEAGVGPGVDASANTTPHATESHLYGLASEGDADKATKSCCIKDSCAFNLRNDMLCRNSEFQCAPNGTNL